MPNFTYCKILTFFFIFSTGGFTYGQTDYYSKEVIAVEYQDLNSGKSSIQAWERINISDSNEPITQAIYIAGLATHTDFITEIEDVTYIISFPCPVGTWSFFITVGQGKFCPLMARTTMINKRDEKLI